MREYLIVGCGGFLGAAGRFFVGEVLLRYSTALRFPIGTLIVNALGCFLIGLTMGLGNRATPAPELRLFLVTGILGGFTTFSAFGFETFQLLRTGAGFLALANIAANVIVSLLLVFFGFTLTQRL